MQRSSAVLIGVVMAVLAPRVAWAELDWQVEVVPGEPTEKVPNPAPNLRVRVVGEAAPRSDAKDAFRLELDPGDNPKRLRSVAPIAVTPFHRSNESLAIVVLVEGHQYYFGNDKYTTEGVNNGVIQKVSKGVFDVIVNALDAPGGSDDEVPQTISKASRNGSSKGALIVYSVGADVRHAMRPLGELTGDKLGAQELQKGKTSRDLAEGLRAALAQLKSASASRRVLFLISDGFDTNGEDMKAIRRQYDAEKIDIFAFHLEAPTQYIPVNEGDQARNKTAMRTLGEGEGSAYYAITNAEALAKKIGEAVGVINSRFYLTFPGSVTDPRSKVTSGFNWDGKEHDVRLLKDDEPVTEKARTVLFQPVWGQVKPKSNLWMWIVFPLGGVVMVGGLVALLSRKGPPPAPAPMPMPVAAPPPVQSPAIQPVAGGGNKTMAINLNSGDGVPVVGWIVPITGPQQFQTMKLFAGVTKVGNVQGAHIVINDPFMSGEHAHVVMSPTGFTLIDNGSTNGTFVNERRVQRHDLIDNDVIKFGKTDCKFKTINTDT